MSITMKKAFNGQAIPIESTLVLTSCHCGINVGVPRNLYRQARENGAELYCPLGHTFVFTKSDLDETKELLEEETRRRKLAQARADRERDRADREERSKIAVKGHLTRQKKRHAHGVCPGCSRSFKQLRAHVKNKHPELLETLDG